MECNKERDNIRSWLSVRLVVSLTLASSKYRILMSELAFENLHLQDLWRHQSGWFKLRAYFHSITFFDFDITLGRLRWHQPRISHQRRQKNGFIRCFQNLKVCFGSCLDTIVSENCGERTYLQNTTWRYWLICQCSYVLRNVLSRLTFLHTW